MKIGVITPFYKGENYLLPYLQCMQENLSSLLTEKKTSSPISDTDFFVILVNDSPTVDLKKCVQQTIMHPNLTGKTLPSMHFITNETNLGIHQSRIIGLKKASQLDATHVIFLDQDDTLSKNAIVLFAKEAQKNPANILIANAMLEQRNWSDKWIRTPYHASKVWDYQTYLSIGTQIISPGQCLLQISAIPTAWKTHILKKNGADDYYLWLLMLSMHTSYHYIDEPLYRHHDTGQNLSKDTTITDESTYAFIEYLQQEPTITSHDLHTLKRMIAYKAAFRSGSTAKKILLSLAHPSLFFKNLSFKKRTNTALGFNR